jgi:hypothetical protein
MRKKDRNAGTERTEKSMAGQQFTGESLVHALESGALTPAPARGVALVGMVKLSETPGCVAFTPAGCETWADVPVALIESAEHIGERRCDDHHHPVVRMTLKEPADAEAKVLRQLLTAFSQVSRSPGRHARPPGRIPRVRGGRQRPPFSPAVFGGGVREGCHNFCDALLRRCLALPPEVTSAECVFLYENCWRVCDGIEWIGGIFDGLSEA